MSDGNELESLAKAEATLASPAAVLQPSLPAKELPVLAGKANDLEALRTAVVDAAGVGAGLWVSYLSVLFYLLVSVGSVTHKDLFLETPVKLPFLSVDLPLKGFFWLGPLLFVIVHAYVLLHFVMLAGKVATFDSELLAQIGDRDIRTKLRRQLPSNIFVQFLAGPTDVRDGILGLSLWLIALITLVIAPVALLVFFELRFLPFHEVAITWLHRGAVGLDLALIWLFWPSIALRRSVADGQDLPRYRRTAAIQRFSTISAMYLLTCCSLLLVGVIATFPGEFLESMMHGADPLGIRRMLVAGEVNAVSRRPDSLWSNRLVLPGFDVVDHMKWDNDAKIDALPESVSLRGRHLEGAVLIGMGLRKADLLGAYLQNAKLDYADLRGAKWCSPAEREGGTNDSAGYICAQLQGASLDFAQLQGASLDYAQLQGASLYRAKLQDASLVGADLQRASLNFAEFQGASLNKARMEGASVVGASFVGAEFKCALLDGAQFQGASLDGAEFQGASVVGAQFQGASLNGAQHLGTSLRCTCRNSPFAEKSPPAAQGAAAIPDESCKEAKGLPAEGAAIRKEPRSPAPPPPPAAASAAPTSPNRSGTAN